MGWAFLPMHIRRDGSLSRDRSRGVQLRGRVHQKVHLMWDNACRRMAPVHLARYRPVPASRTRKSPSDAGCRALASCTTVNAMIQFSTPRSTDRPADGLMWAGIANSFFWIGMGNQAPGG